MNVVAIEVFESFDGSLLRGDVFGDLRQQVLRERLTNLTLRMQPAQLGNERAKIDRTVRHLLRRCVAREFFRPFRMPGPARMNDEDRFGLQRHPPRNRFDILRQRRSVVGLHGDDVVVLVSQCHRPKRRFFHARLVRMSMDVRQVDSTIDVPLHIA